MVWSMEALVPCEIPAYPADDEFVPILFVVTLTRRQPSNARRLTQDFIKIIKKKLSQGQIVQFEVKNQSTIVKNY